MKIAICTVAYNERRFIGPCIRQFAGFGFHHLVLVSTKPWNGTVGEYDGTADVAREAGAEVILGYWETESEQRNWGLAHLRDYDFVLIVDPDEFYTKDDIRKIKEGLEQVYHETIYGFRPAKILTYWKNYDYQFNPPDQNTPVIAVNPKNTQFKKFRMIRQFADMNWEWSGQPVIDVTVHHMSWARTDDEVRTKIDSYSHVDNIGSQWYEGVWRAWKPGSDIVVRPYGVEQSTAVYAPAPDEIKALLPEM